MDYPEVKELKCRTEYVFIDSKANSMKMSPFISENDNSISVRHRSGTNSISRRLLNESITNPSRQMIFNDSYNQINKIYKELKFDNEEIIVTALKIIQSCIIRNINDFKISKTGKNELLIFRKINGEFTNIILDEDCDVSYMFIGKKPGTEKSQFFPKSKGLDYSKFASLL